MQSKHKTNQSVKAHFTRISPFSSKIIFVEKIFGENRMYDYALCFVFVHLKLEKLKVDEYFQKTLFERDGNTYSLLSRWQQKAKIMHVANTNTSVCEETFDYSRREAVFFSFWL